MLQDDIEKCENLNKFLMLVGCEVELPKWDKFWSFNEYRLECLNILVGCMGMQGEVYERWRSGIGGLVDSLSLGKIRHDIESIKNRIQDLRIKVDENDRSLVDLLKRADLVISSQKLVVEELSKLDESRRTLHKSISYIINLNGA